MSTIFGVVKCKKEHDVTIDELTRMQNRLNHWGADYQDVWTSGNAGFGNLMLFNTPESLTEKLPYYSEQTGVVITADARIDNREEIFQLLNLEPIENKNISDSILILKLYEKFQDLCVDYLIGDFAFAIWDQVREQLFCARDHLGVRPFYYYQDDFFFAFSSEKKGLLSISGMNSEINDVFVVKTVADIPLNNEETIYKHINRLEGGSTLLMFNGKSTLKKYWSLNAKKETIFKNKEEYITVFKEKFEEAIRCRMRSNYLIGTELSGGLDSAGITCLVAKMAHESNKKIACFSEVIPVEARQKEIICDEYYIDLIEGYSKIDYLKKMPSNYNSINYKEGKFLQDIDLSLEISDGPTNSFSSFSNQLKVAASKENVRTLFSGFMGDNLITSQNRNYYLDYIPRRKYISYFREARKQIGYVASLKGFIKIQLRLLFNTFYLKINRKKILESYQNDKRNFLKDEKFQMIEPYIKVKNKELIYYKEIQKQLIEHYSVAIRFENEIHNGKKYKVEPCFPMADVRLVEYVLSLPTSEKMSSGKGRLLFKKAMKGIVPDELLENQTKKNGHSDEFGIKNWVLRQKEAKSWMENCIVKNVIPELIATEKIMKGYNLEFKNKNVKKIKDLEVYGRFPIESLIRWFEIKKK
jgi:asparagine synthase (glutamine-hydrolysing)